MDPNDAVDPDLGHDRKQGRHGGTGCGIGTGQPQVDRHDGRFQAKDHQQ